MKYATTRPPRDSFQGAVSVNIILKKDGKYLLLRRAHTGWADGYYTLPAGHLDGNEPLTAAAAREAREEIGVTIDRADLRLVHIMHRSNRDDDRERLDFYFLAERWTGEPHLAEPDKADDVRWFALSELPDRMIEYPKTVLQQYQTQPLSERNWD